MLFLCKKKKKKSAWEAVIFVSESLHWPIGEFARFVFFLNFEILCKQQQYWTPPPQKKKKFAGWKPK